MAEEKGTEKQGKSGLVKKILIIAVGVLLLAGVGAGGYFAGTSRAVAEPVPADAAKAPAKPAAVALGPLVPLTEFIVNIMDGQETRYLKAAITLEMTQAEAAQEVGRREAQVRDAILLLIGSKTFDELRDLHGKLQLRADLAARINGFLTAGEVKEIYFTEFVIQ